jgi:hypothetical protein
VDYTQDGEEVPEDQKIKLRKLIKMVVIILILAGILVVVEELLHIYILLYVWPALLAGISIFALLRRRR